MNSKGSITSKMSSISLRNMISFVELIFGQNLNNPIITSSVNKGSFSKNCTTP